MLDQTKEPGFVFTGVVVDRIRFDDVPAGSLPPANLEYQVGIQRKLLDSPVAAEITINLALFSPQGQTKFILEVAVSGRFQATDGPNIPLEQFATVHGPAIVMPFVREIVANISARSRNGIVLLPPINVVELVRKQQESGIAPQHTAQRLGAG